MRPLVQRKTRLGFATEDAVYSAGRMRPVCVEAGPLHVGLRLKGEPRERAIQVSWATLYRYAEELAVVAERNGLGAERAALVDKEARRAG